MLWVGLQARAAGNLELVLRAAVAAAPFCHPRIVAAPIAPIASKPDDPAVMTDADLSAQIARLERETGVQSSIDGLIAAVKGGRGGKGW